MPEPILSDNAMRLIHLALDGLARRQEAIGRNLANVDTPGYQAQAVEFEGALQRALSHGNPAHLDATNPGHLPPADQQVAYRLAPRPGGALRADGNNVDIDLELNQMAETGIRYQALTQLASKKLLLLKAIANNR